VRIPEQRVQALLSELGSHAVSTLLLPDEEERSPGVGIKERLDNVSTR